MKLVILAGGLGTRLSEETELRPKPMVEIGGKPILWHIMKIYSHFGVREFVVCLGYKGYVIKEYFNNYFLHTSDVTIDLATGDLQVHSKRAEPWKITLVDTGNQTMTGGRLLRVAPYVGKSKSFMLTYGDGVSNVNIRELVKFHHAHKKMATVTAVPQPGRFGNLKIAKNGQVESFIEKPLFDGSLINGGFFIFNRGVFDYLSDDQTVLEGEPLANLARDKELAAFRHDGFWHPMDTLRDKRYLEDLWSSGQAPWKVW